MKPNDIFCLCAMMFPVFGIIVAIIFVLKSPLRNNEKQYEKHDSPDLP